MGSHFRLPTPVNFPLPPRRPSGTQSRKRGGVSMEVNLKTLPERMSKLPLDPQRGVPVPWFVAWVDGKPEFRAADGSKFVRAIREMRCWVCGYRLGVHLSFVVGPMCLVNMTTSEPPCHKECAEWSAQNCPFLTRPRMVRRDENLPAGWVPPAGEGLDRNPGVAAVYTARDYKLFPDGRGGKLIRMPEEHTSISWWSEGREATREEI